MHAQKDYIMKLLFMSTPDLVITQMVFTVKHNKRILKFIVKNNTLFLRHYNTFLSKFTFKVKSKDGQLIKDMRNETHLTEQR